MTAEKTGHLIERYYNGTLHYWSARSADSAYLNRDDARDLNTGAWTPKAEDAIWFADANSAGGVLAWCLGGVGRVTEHMMVGADLQKAQSEVPK